MAGLSWPWWCQRLWHSLSLLWLCPLVTFTPHVISLYDCLHEILWKISLFCPSCLQSVLLSSWGWSEPHNCCISGLLYLLSIVSLAAIDRYILWSSFALAPEMHASSWAVHWAGSSSRVLSGSQELSLGLSISGGTFARRQIASQRLKVFDLKGILSIAGAWSSESLQKGV